MIGVFTIPIGQLMLDIKAERESETSEIEKINQALEVIMQGSEFEVKSYE